MNPSTSSTDQKRDIEETAMGSIERRGIVLLHEWSREGTTVQEKRDCSRGTGGHNRRGQPWIVAARSKPTVGCRPWPRPIRLVALPRGERGREREEEVESREREEGGGGGLDLEATLGIYPSSAVGREDLGGAGVGTVVLDRRGRGMHGRRRPRHRCIP